MNARKERIARAGALAILSEVDELYVARGRRFDIVAISDGQVAKVSLRQVLGPTGNMRAPALRSGRKLIVGFSAEMLQLAL